MDLKQIFAEARQVALYQDPKYGSVYVGSVFEHDEQYHGGDVRISQPLDVRFDQMPQDELIQTAVAALEAAELKVRNDMQQQINEIRERKQQLLALTNESVAA